MTDFIEKFCEFVIADQVPFIYGAVLIFAALLSGARLEGKVHHLIRELREGLAALSEAHEAQGFFSRFSRIDTRIREIPALEPLWSEFKENLIHPPVESESSEQKIRNSYPAAAYFNEASLLSPRLGLRHTEALPNYFTGLGILGTFIGLSAGIYLAGETLAPEAGTLVAGMEAPDPNAIMNGMTKLLGGAALAFVTSVCGLSASLSFGWYSRHRIDTVRQAIDGWNHALDERVELVTVEQLAGQQLEQLVVQSTQLKRFNTDLAVSIADALDERMAGSIVPALQTMVEAIDGLRGDQAGTNQEMLDGVAKGFLEALTGSVKDQFQQVSDTLGKLDAAIRESAAAVDTSNKAAERSIRDSTAAVTQTLKTAFEDLTTNLRAAVRETATELKSAGQTVGRELRGGGQSLSTELGKAAESAEGLAPAFDLVAEGITDAGNQIVLAATPFAEAATKLAELQVGIGEATTELGKTVNELAFANERSAKSAEKTARIVERVEAAVDMIKKVQVEAATAWRTYENRFQSLDEALAGVLAQITDSLTDYTREMRKFTSEVDTEMATSVKLLSGAIQQLDETLSEAELGGDGV